MKSEYIFLDMLVVAINTMQSQLKLDPLPEKLLQEALAHKQYSGRAIDRVLVWMRTILELPERFSTLPNKTSMRVYGKNERQRIDTKAQGFLFFLEQRGVVEPAVREMIIDQALRLPFQRIDFHLMRGVILAVLFFLPNQKRALACVEFFILDDANNKLH